MAKASRYASRNPWSKPQKIVTPTAPSDPRIRIRKRRKAKLPQELIELIIDYISDEPETLKSCSLAAQSFLPQTRKYLFCKFSIRLNHSSQNLRLVALFEKSPYLKQYIRDLKVVVQPPPTRAAYSEELPINQVLPSFKRSATSLTIKAYGGIPVDWQTDLTPLSQDSISHILTAGSVLSCSLHDILNFDPVYLARCPSLRHFGLSGHSTLTAYKLPLYFAGTRVPCLSSLTIGNSMESFQSLLDCCMGSNPAVQLNNLQSLDVEEDMAMPTFIDLPFLRFTLSALVVRLRQYPDDSFPVPEPINLSKFQRLSSVELRCVDDERGMSFALRSARIIESISQPSLLGKVTFTYDPTPDPWTSTYSSFNEAYWSCVDAALFHLPLSPFSLVQFKYGTSVIIPNSANAFPKVRSLGVHVLMSPMS